MRVTSPKIEEAIIYFKEVHANQKRKYSGEPYFNHLFEVATYVSEVSSGEEMIIAALGHDSAEDQFIHTQEFNYQWVIEKFGYNVIVLISELTDQYTSEAYPHFNRATRKKLERETWINKSDRAKTIKLADLISNTKDILVQDPGFAITYIKEKALLLPYLKGGNELLLYTAQMQVDRAVKELDIKL
jgi:(p)ppGpp synthase/HD superfamily hydrolase